MTVASHKIGFRPRRRGEAEMAPADPARRAPLPRFALVSDAEAERTNDDVVAELALVAEEHAPEGGYGETAWNAESGAVFWQCADWSGNEEVDAAEAAFRAVEGVREFEYDAEGGLPYDYDSSAPLEGWEIVWPSSMTAAGVAPPAPAAAAQEPPEAHSGLLKTAMDALLALASRPAPVPDVHVHVGSPELSVKVEPAETHVHVPEQPVHLAVEAPPAPDVHVTVEAPPAPPAPDVHVAVQPADVHIEVPPAPPPDVHVQVDVPRPGPVRVEKTESGGRVYIPEPAE